MKQRKEQANPHFHDVVIVLLRLIACQEAWPHSGPSHAEQLVNWAEDPILRMLHDDAFAFKDIPENVWHTSKWCGVATSTLAWMMSAQKIEELAGIKFHCDLYAHCEFDATCRKCLRKNKPRHLHVDILEPFDSELVDDVKCIQRKFRDRLAQRPLSRNELFDEFLDNVIALVDAHDLPFLNKAFCEIHNKECKIMPPGLRRKRKALWMEQVSPTCTSWSQQNSRPLGWLDVKQIPLILYMTRCATDVHRPDLILLECVTGLDIAGCEKLSKNKIKFQVRNLQGCEVGLPVGGVRLWAAAVANGWQFKFDPFSSERMEKIGYRRLELEPTELLGASKEEVTAWHNAVNERRGDKGLVPHPRGKMYSPHHLLSPGARERLEGHQEQTAVVRRASVAAGHIEHLVPQVWDISQTIHHHQAPGPFSPRPLTSSVMWTESFERMVTPLEMLHLQGPCQTKKHACICVCLHVYICIYVI